MQPLETAVLLLVFNRPKETQQVFTALQQARPSRLYIASDGPREGNDTDQENIMAVREIVAKVDWECTVSTLFREQNLGCKNAVSSAITWFFSHEEEGIILEDDCVPDQSFFLFCQELLAHYRHDTRVMAISGDNYQCGQKRTSFSYYFSRYPHCWGWATWKRAWQLWDGSLRDWPEVNEQGLLENIADGNPLFAPYWRKIFEACFAGNIDSWAYPWTFTCWKQSGMTILPNVNLVSNIGFGPDATHTKREDSRWANLSADAIRFPLDHPPYMIRDFAADRYTEEEHFSLNVPPPPPRYTILQKIAALIRPRS